jgi:hypothetical protein
MLLTEPLPFEEALEQIERRTPIGSALSSAQWAQMPLALRDRAFFSAKVQDVGFLAQARKLSEAIAAGTTNRAAARTELKRFLGTLGADVDESDLTDLRSDARLNLILDTNVQQAQGYGAFLQGQDPAILDQWPAQELIRVIDAKEPRDWLRRWTDAGGLVFPGNRMIALKNDPIWVRISRFGAPYPPFDYNSGMDVQDVERDEAVALRLIAPDTVVPPQIEEFNERLQASIPNADDATMEGLRDVFGDQVDVSREGKVVWQGSRIHNLYEQALADPDVKWSLDLGRGTESTHAQARAAGVELPENARLMLDADHIRHADRRHGAAERDPAQRPLTSLDVELVPHVWREPDRVRAGDLPGDLIFEKSLLDRLVMVTWKPAPSGRVRLHSLVVKQEGDRS